MSPDQTSSPVPTVWIFHGEGAPFAAGVFVSRAEGVAWAQRHGVTGQLTEYLVGDGCYDVAVRTATFRPTKPHHGSPGHIAGFSSGGEHVHIVDGLPD
ncbi:hypothetical protein SAMN05421684_1920 [Asanoa ishikariensis]|uniref:DUF7710 domain-containing protein n=1 Tax=Asanoa ishikariensis TaxID=137265 RepID=A0A1H3N9G1_9ACTN|nr:hypothetical protein SAMN05421684_1920 [Asanoa ishikariensis]